VNSGSSYQAPLSGMPTRFRREEVLDWSDGDAVADEKAGEEDDSLGAQAKNQSQGGGSG
jgi:hypothetical protein